MSLICPNCGLPAKRLVRHHVSYFPPKTIIVCDSCHRIIHKSRGILFNGCISIRFAEGEVLELNSIAFFEHEKRAVLLRRFIIEKVQTYLRNPAYKRFLKQLEEKALRERERELRKAEEKKWK
jgi:hypothetical protein